MVSRKQSQVALSGKGSSSKQLHEGTSFSGTDINSVPGEKEPTETTKLIKKEQAETVIRFS